LKVIVGHHYWNEANGSTLVSAYVAKVLAEEGNDVALASTFKIDFNFLKKWSGIDLSHCSAYYLRRRIMPVLGIYQELLFNRALLKATKNFKPDLIFLDWEGYKSLLGLKDHQSFKLIEYIHFPFSILLHEKKIIKRNDKGRKYLDEVRNYYSKYQKGLWRAYFWIFLKLYKRIARDNPFNSADKVLANSKYVARVVKIIWGKEPEILYPPVRVSDFRKLQDKGFNERDNAVVIIGRITPEKKIETVIDAISKTETKPILRVIGGLTSAQRSYKKHLEKKAKELGIEIEFHLNVSRDELVRLATSSKVLVHATIGEHFGIAPVEGMAAGCPIIVHRSGGAYEDILGEGKYGLSFESIDELAELIDRLLGNPSLWRQFHIFSITRAEEFSEEKFRSRLIRFVKAN